MESIDSPSLLYRPMRHELERFNDYFRRVSEGNGFESQIGFSRHLRKSAPNVGPHKHSKSDVGRAVRRLYHLLGRDLVKSCRDDFESFERLYIEPHKVCPSCLNENGVTRFYWYFHEYNYCHVHMQEMERVDVRVSGERAVEKLPVQYERLFEIIKYYENEENSGNLIARELMAVGQFESALRRVNELSKRLFKKSIKYSDHINEIAVGVLLSQDFGGWIDSFLIDLLDDDFESEFLRVYLAFQLYRTIGYQSHKRGEFDVWVEWFEENIFSYEPLREVVERCQADRSSSAFYENRDELSRYMDKNLKFLYWYDKKEMLETIRWYC